MDAAALLHALRARGIVLSAVGERLRVEAPRGLVTPELRAALTAHKAAILALLQQESQWPPQCREAERLYHRPPVLEAPHAKLFPLVGQRVLTPRGPGVLLQAFAGQATVALESDPNHAAIFEPQEIRPLSAAP
ncbi:hypothetical protein U7230_07060 [Carboxydochorda subterranea]|uniref:TubC N-terminal docking domain-containing protein n=1 Tax=Carboxydichorda subterranea TaxID=3109565 RepID=A0ABZ1C270_9FIRM|nr:hypothetical protein [Limnochorda sp. L945t]WRP18935.1 hypothetical protein U7230_07060 [Limnochorda sp. L945t]